MTALQTTETLMAGVKAIFKTYEGETASQHVFAEVEEDETTDEIHLQLEDTARRYAENKGYEFLRIEGEVKYNKAS